MKIPLNNIEYCAFCGYIKQQCECEKPQTNYVEEKHWCEVYTEKEE